MPASLKKKRKFTGKREKVSSNHPLEVTGYHSCNKEIGLKVLNGEDALRPSDNSWDWLGPGLYFWEQNPMRALEYAVDSAKGKQFNRVRIEVPFVLGTSIHLGKCLNLLEPESLSIMTVAYEHLVRSCKDSGFQLPKNESSKRLLDCAVIKVVHQLRFESGLKPYDTIRAYFSEGRQLYPSTTFTTQSHVQICVCNLDMIKGYFLPRPLRDYNPYLNSNAYSQ
jgi:hypothetical protein